MSQNFDQAQALIKRLMEGVGGSADAYEAPLAPPSSVPEVSDLPKPIGSDEEETEISGDLPDLPSEDQEAQAALLARLSDQNEVCIAGDIEWPEDGAVWTNPPPISPEYHSRGVVEDSEELKLIWEAFRAALNTGQPQKVKLETGTHLLSRRAAGANFGNFFEGWQLLDPVKNRLYRQETDLSFASFLEPSDTFIWVTEGVGGADLGYIHEGYIFLRQ